MNMMFNQDCQFQVCGKYLNHLNRTGAETFEGPVTQDGSKCKIAAEGWSFALV